MEIVTKFCSIYKRTRTKINIHDHDIEEVSMTSHKKSDTCDEFYVFEVESKHGRISVFLNSVQAEKLHNELSECFAEKVEV